MQPPHLGALVIVSAWIGKTEGVTASLLGNDLLGLGFVLGISLLNHPGEENRMCRMKRMGRILLAKKEILNILLLSSLSCHSDWFIF
jgi:hypothetical protein